MGPFSIYLVVAEVVAVPRDGNGLPEVDVVDGPGSQHVALV